MEKAHRRRRLWPRLLLALLLLAVAALAWLNGPGLRWLAPKVAAHFMAKAGMRGSLVVDGSLTSGLEIRNILLESDTTLERLSVKRVKPLYQLSELISGRVGGIRIEGLHADLRIEAEASDEQKTESATKFDPSALAATLQRIREQVIPLEVLLDEVSIKATKNGKDFLALAPSRLEHLPGDSQLRITLGTITDTNKRVWPEQQSTLIWEPEQLQIDQLLPLPGIGIRDLIIRLPSSGELSAETVLRLDEAVIFVEATPGLKSANINLREGSLKVSELLNRFGIEAPADATVTSLAISADQLMPDPKAATGDVRILLENVISGEWSVPELSIDLGMDEANARLAASGKSLGTEFALTTETPVSRSGGTFAPGETRGKFNVVDLSRLTAALAEKLDFIDPQKPLPPSILDGSFQLALEDQKPSRTNCELIIKPADQKQAASLLANGSWAPQEPLTFGLSTEGLKMDATYDTAAEAYKGTATFNAFDSTRIQPWLEPFRIVLGMSANLDGAWKGSGALKDGTHRGELNLASLKVSRPEMPELTAKGIVDYDWPAQVTTRKLLAESNGQSIAADLKLANQWLELGGLRWLDRGREMASGSAKLPVPQDFSKWRDLLTDDSKPLDLVIESQTLPLSTLKDWLPAAAKLDGKSSGRLSIKVAGTCAKPLIDARAELRDLRSPEQPKLPPADLTLSLSAKENRISIEGQALAPDFAPAVLTASMPFHPKDWAEETDKLLNEPITARVDLPQVDLSRFGSLVAAANKLAGTLTGNIEVGGKVGKPEIKGTINLAKGAFEPKDRSLPALAGISAGVDLSLERITLKALQASLSGGEISASGFLDLRDGKPGAIDFRLNGRYLPVRRDESLIVRSNADIRLSGPWETAALTGTVGIVDSLFFRDIELLPIGSPFTAPSAASLPKLDAPAPSATTSMPLPFRDWTMNVRAHTEEPFLIRGNLATGAVVADLRIEGTLGKPTPSGEVRISDFKASLPFTTLKVKSGLVQFSPANGFDPSLEIRATAEPRPYRVNAYIYGKASNPQLLLTSSPPLPENEIMTLLATGTTTTGLEDPQAASSRAMQLLAEEMRRGRFAVGKQLRPLLAMADRVDFSLGAADPYTSEKYSTATLALTEKWFLSAGMGEEGGTRAFAIWRLTFR